MRLRLRPVLTGAAATAATILFAVSATGTAYADSTARSVNPTGAATVTFQSYGEHFFLHDDRADGRGAVLHLFRYDTTNNYTYFNHDGAGTSVDIDLSMAEGTLVSYYVCSSIGTETIWSTCGTEINDTA